jgi:hypothetical protein
MSVPASSAIPDIKWFGLACPGAINSLFLNPNKPKEGTAFCTELDIIVLFLSAI